MNNSAEYRRMKKILKRNNYSLLRSHGDHFVYGNKDGRHITITHKLNPVIAQRLIKENNLIIGG